VNSAADPFYNRRLIDRYLISVEQGGMTPVIVINKIELMVEDMLREDLEVYERLGIPVIYCSCEKGTGIEKLKSAFAGKTSALFGASGVGKSSIVNACFGIELQDVREISEKYIKGKHTTTSGKLFALPSAGFLIDTPGMREFAVYDVHPDDVGYYFHEFDPYFQLCKYLPCTHTHEPHCAVKKALEDGLLDEQRYDSYLRIRESLQ
jgi:ribosome biogenesis GTPase